MWDICRTTANCVMVGRQGCTECISKRSLDFFYDGFESLMFVCCLGVKYLGVQDMFDLRTEVEDVVNEVKEYIKGDVVTEVDARARRVGQIIRVIEVCGLERFMLSPEVLVVFNGTLRWLCNGGLWECVQQHQSVMGEIVRRNSGWMRIAESTSEIEYIDGVKGRGVWDSGLRGRLSDGFVGIGKSDWV